MKSDVVTEHSISFVHPIFRFDFQVSSNDAKKYWICDVFLETLNTSYVLITDLSYNGYSCKSGFGMPVKCSRGNPNRIQGTKTAE